MKNDRKYYMAYEERYKTAHQKGVSWASSQHTPIVVKTLQKYYTSPNQSILEIGCGEGRDAREVLQNGYHLLATDLSPEAVSYCKAEMPMFADRFRVLDCLADPLEETFDFIYSVAVIHMLVLDEDRDGFYRFVYGHLKPEGLALICTMGDGTFEMQTDIRTAFVPQEREHASGKMMVAGTSCRMVAFQTWRKEMERNHLEIVEQGITSALPDFNSLMYAVVKKEVEKRNGWADEGIGPYE